jgi:hypothetical protein
MANQETQLVDDILIQSRRKLLTLGATSLAGMVLGAALPEKAHAATTYTDNDILNFALNLEYLEANFYYQAAFGTTIDVANAASTAAGAPLITLNQTVGTKGTVTGGSKVPFTTVQVGSYAVETAVEEGKHVAALQSALGSLAVAQPAINIAAGTPGAFGTLATAALIPGGAALTDADGTNVIAFARNTTQVLNITGGGAVNVAGTAAVSPAIGVFFPAGLNGLFK